MTQALGRIKTAAFYLGVGTVGRIKGGAERVCAAVITHAPARANAPGSRGGLPSRGNSNSQFKRRGSDAPFYF
jgi:hypothetical protein